MSDKDIEYNNNYRIPSDWLSRSSLKIIGDNKN